MATSKPSIKYMKLNPLKWNLHWQILASLVGALLAGLYLLPNLSPSLTEGSLSFSQLISEIFMNALKMVIVPLIASSMIASIIQLGSDSRIGVIGAKTFFYFSFLSPLKLWTRECQILCLQRTISNLVSSPSTKLCHFYIFALHFPTTNSSLNKVFMTFYGPIKIFSGGRFPKCHNNNKVPCQIPVKETIH